MKCDEFTLKIQALVDNELESNEIDQVVEHIHSCYSCKKEYMDLLKIQRKFKEAPIPLPPEEWFEKLSRSFARRTISIVGKLIFFLSYVLLLTYTVVSIFKKEDIFVIIGLGGIISGLVILLGLTFFDRWKESKTDKYKGVLK